VHLRWASRTWRIWRTPRTTRSKAVEAEILDQATAARTIVELKAEITTLQGLESLAATVHRSGADRKWRELANQLAEIFTPAAANRVSEASAATGAARP
jgi:hypothetical protein